jgi:hypothetical protein
MITTSVRPGEWFLGVRCDCSEWIVMDASEGPASKVTLPAKLNLSCDACGRAASCVRR